MFTIESLETALAKTKNALAVSMARRQELSELLNNTDESIAKIKGRIELLNEQVGYCKNHADEQGA